KPSRIDKVRHRVACHESPQRPGTRKAHDRIEDGVAGLLECQWSALVPEQQCEGEVQEDHWRGTNTTGISSHHNDHQEADMNWSAEYPQEPGWYWCRCLRADVIGIPWIVSLPVCRGDPWRKPSDDLHVTIEWAGPILPPCGDEKEMILMLP